MSDDRSPLLDFPDGNGDKDCPKCKGRGVVPMMMDVGGVEWPGGGTQNCDCVFKRDLLANVKRVWKVLLTVESVDESPLIEMTKQNLWVTASNFELRRHLRFVAFRMGPKWDARVIADATLVTAWLSTVKDVYDPDVHLEREGNRDRPSEHFFTIVDIAVPFDLLIIRLGVKAAKNREMPNVLLEAINERELAGKPTWVVDSPLKPLGPNHICYSDGVAEVLDGFRRIQLSVSGTPSMAPTTGARRSGQVQQAGQMVAGNYTNKPVLPPMPDGANLTMDPDAEDDVEPTTGPPVELADDDEVSVDALLASSGDTAVEVAKPEPDGGFDVDEALENYPTPEELGASGTPSWLKGTPLTKEDRVAKQKADKRDKRRKK